MQVSLIDIGTSKGIRLPSAILKKFNSIKGFELEIKQDKLILKAIRKPRIGWEEKFKSTSDKLLVDDALDIEEWDEI